MTTPSPNTDGRELRTGDLTLAAILHMHGYTEPKMHRRPGNRACWVFVMDEYVRDLVREFNSGTCQVEPKAFMRAVGAVRSGLYKFLGHNPGRVSSN